MFLDPSLVLLDGHKLVAKSFLTGQERKYERGASQGIPTCPQVPEGKGTRKQERFGMVGREEVEGETVRVRPPSLADAFLLVPPAAILIPLGP